MSKYEVINSENCYICSEFMGSFRSDLTVCTGYTERPIYQIIGKFVVFWKFSKYSRILFDFLEIFTNTTISDDVINESGVCQNCFIRFNEYDEHQSMADEIQRDLVSLMENKIFTLEEEMTTQVKVEQQEEEIIASEVDYEIYEAQEDEEEEQLFEEDDENEGETVVEAIDDDYHFEIVVDDTKENVKGKQVRATEAKPKMIDGNPELIILQLDDHSTVYQCDICFKTCKDKSKLRSHREIHTSERNVICPTCGKGFKTMNCLRNHKRLHLPMRTYYNCDQCEKKYTQKVSDGSSVDHCG